MSEFRLVPRTEIGLPAVVTNSDGVTPRPAIENCIYLTAHGTGVPVVYGDPGDTDAEILQIQAVWANSKPFEYNYVIGQDDDDLVYEFAGTFRAAHSAGENSISIGVLFLNGTFESITPLQVRKWQWLREVLKYFGVLVPNVDQRMHRMMPGAQTQCVWTPNTTTNDAPVWLEMKRPYVELPPTDPQEDEVIPVVNGPKRAADTRWYGPNGKVPAGQTRAFKIDPSIVPAHAKLVYLTITATEPVAPGWAAIWGKGAYPGHSSLNWSHPGQQIANTTVTEITNGTVYVRTSAATHIILDAIAWS